MKLKNMWTNFKVLYSNLSESSKWELGFVHYSAKFTILRFVISRFEYVYILGNRTQFWILFILLGIYLFILLNTSIGLWDIIYMEQPEMGDRHTAGFSQVFVSGEKNDLLWRTSRKNHTTPKFKYSENSRRNHVS